MSDALGARSPASSCCKASSLSPTQAAVMAKYWIMRLPLVTSFSTGVSAIARLPSSNARSLRPRAASIKPRTQSAGRSPAAPARSFPAVREPLQTQCALLPHLWSCAPSRPSPKLRLRIIALSPQHGLSPTATSARSAAAGSRSARAQKNQMSAARAMAPGPCARIASIVWRSGRVSPFQQT